MKTNIFILTTVAILLAACGDDVPKVEDPHDVIVDGKPMAQKDFLLKYCAGKPNNETCLKVSKAMSLDSGKSKTGIPRF